VHEVLLERAAERDLKALSRAVYDRIVSHLKTLSQSPRSAGCKKIKGPAEIDDRAKVVKVMRIRHRRESYR